MFGNIYIFITVFSLKLKTKVVEKTFRTPFNPSQQDHQGIFADIYLLQAYLKSFMFV